MLVCQTDSEKAQLRRKRGKHVQSSFLGVLCLLLMGLLCTIYKKKREELLLNDHFLFGRYIFWCCICFYCMYFESFIVIHTIWINSCFSCVDSGSCMVCIPVPRTIWERLYSLQVLCWGKCYGVYQLAAWSYFHIWPLCV